MRECKDNKFGVPKRDDTTADMQYIMEGLLATGDIAFSEELTSFSHSSENMIKEVVKQFKAFVWDVEPSRTDPDKCRVKLTGKKSGGQDDLLISLMMIPYWRRVFLDSERNYYEEFKKNYIYNH